MSEEKRVLVGVDTGEQLHRFLDKGWDILKGCNGPTDSRGHGGWWLWFGNEQAARDQYAMQQARFKDMQRF